MPAFGEKSKTLLATCHPLLQRILDEAIRHVDFTIVAGFRGQEAQDEAFRTGASTKPWPKSNHNTVATQKDVDEGFAPNVGAPLSHGVDFAPWHKDPPHIRWKMENEFYLYAGIFRGIGLMLLPSPWYLRLGGDWDLDGDVTDQSFNDVGHIEIRQRAK